MNSYKYGFILLSVCLVSSITVVPLASGEESISIDYNKPAQLNRCINSKIPQKGLPESVFGKKTKQKDIQFISSMPDISERILDAVNYQNIFDNNSFEILTNESSVDMETSGQTFSFIGNQSFDIKIDEKTFHINASRFTNPDEAKNAYINQLKHIIFKSRTDSLYNDSKLIDRIKNLSYDDYQLVLDHAYNDRSFSSMGVLPDEKEIDLVKAYLIRYGLLGANVTQTQIDNPGTKIYDGLKFIFKSLIFNSKGENKITLTSLFVRDNILLYLSSNNASNAEIENLTTLLAEEISRTKEVESIIADKNLAMVDKIDISIGKAEHKNTKLILNISFTNPEDLRYINTMIKSDLFKNMIGNQKFITGRGLNDKDIPFIQGIETYLTEEELKECSSLEFLVYTSDSHNRIAENRFVLPNPYYDND